MAVAFSDSFVRSLRASRVAARIVLGTAIFAAAGLALAEELDRRGVVARLGSDVEDAPAQWEKRWAPLRAALPARSRIGYLADGASSDVLCVAYVLSPRVLDPNGRHAFAVADLRDDAAVSDLAAREDWTVLARSGDGLAVLAHPGGASR